MKLSVPIQSVPDNCPRDRVGKIVKNIRHALWLRWCYVRSANSINGEPREETNLSGPTFVAKKKSKYDNVKNIIRRHSTEFVLANNDVLFSGKNLRVNVTVVENKGRGAIPNKKYQKDPAKPTWRSSSRRKGSRQKGVDRCAG